MIPQLIRVLKLRSAREISMIFITLLITGMICWLAYGVYLKLFPVILWNAIGAILASFLIYLKLKYGK
jgi:MtN3 and saliva related transmembrane protein